jgi:hypothetical protein
MNVTFDRNLFTQIGLDSASLTMLGSVVHSFLQPGDYRAVVHKGPEVITAFTIRSDTGSSNAQATIDLATLASVPDASHPEGCSCCADRGTKEGGPREFVVNPRGFVLFHVSRGAGGYYVHARRADTEEQDKGYDSRTLAPGDVFTAIVLRPGTYTMANSLTGSKGELVVTYPKPGEKRYRPGAALRVVCHEKGLEPDRVQIGPGQGVIFESHVPARIQIKLEKPDDGPKRKEPRRRRTGLLANRLR